MKTIAFILLTGLLYLGVPSGALAEDMCHVGFVPSGPWKNSCKDHFWSHCDGTDFTCKIFHASCEYETIYRETYFNKTEINCEKMKACKGKLKNKDGKLTCN